MAIISAGDIWKMFEWTTEQGWIRSRKKDKQAVVEWLEAVQVELEALSQVWSEVLAEEERARPLDSVHHWHTSRVNTFLNRQVPVAKRLQDFYASATSVLGPKTDAVFREDFISALGQVVFRRDRLRDLADSRNRLVLVSPENEYEQINSLRSAEAAIQRELSTIHVLITNFKALK